MTYTEVNNSIPTLYTPGVSFEINPKDLRFNQRVFFFGACNVPRRIKIEGPVHLSRCEEDQELPDDSVCEEEQPHDDNL